MVYSGAWGKLIHEKNQKSKLSWHCPLKSSWRYSAPFGPTYNILAGPQNILKESLMLVVQV